MSLSKSAYYANCQKAQDTIRIQSILCINKLFSHLFMFYVKALCMYLINILKVPENHQSNLGCVFTLYLWVE